MKIMVRIIEPDRPQREWEYSGHKLSIGRDPDCKLSFTGRSAEVVSWRHADIELQANGALITDLGSTNGSFVNGVRVNAPTAVRVGDEIALGQGGPRLQVSAFGAEASAPVERTAIIAQVVPSESKISAPAAAPTPSASSANKPAYILAAAISFGCLLFASVVIYRATQGSSTNPIPDNRENHSVVTPDKTSQSENNNPVKPEKKSASPEVVKTDWTKVADPARQSIVWVAGEIEGARVLLGGGWMAKPDTVVTSGHFAAFVNKFKQQGYRCYVASSLADETTVREAQLHPLYQADQPGAPGSIHCNVGLLKLEKQRSGRVLELASDDDVIKSLTPKSEVLVAGYPIAVTQLVKTYSRETMPSYTHWPIKVGLPDTVSDVSLSPRRKLEVTSPPGMFGLPALNDKGLVVGMAVQLDTDKDKNFANDPVYCITANAIRQAIK